MQQRWGQPARSVFQRDIKQEERGKEKRNGGLHAGICASAALNVMAGKEAGASIYFTCAQLSGPLFPHRRGVNVHLPGKGLGAGSNTQGTSVTCTQCSSGQGGQKVLEMGDILGLY